VHGFKPLRALALGFALGLSLGLPAPSLADGARTPEPAIVIANPGHCIAPAAEMRRNHPEMLKHQRDVTVHTGTRGARVRLNACIECHASRTNGSVVGGDDNFCQACHAYLAVRLDCFECHQATRAAARTALAHTGPQP
jgi:hypothetical protein